MITIKRVYDAVGPTDGTRLLIERSWPKKTLSKIKSWIKDVAPVQSYTNGSAMIQLCGMSSAGVILPNSKPISTRGIIESA